MSIHHYSKCHILQLVYKHLDDSYYERVCGYTVFSSRGIHNCYTLFIKVTSIQNTDGMCHKTNRKDLELVHNLLLWIHFIWVYVIVINDLEGTHAHTHIHVNIHYDVHTHTHTHIYTHSQNKSNFKESKCFSWHTLVLKM